MEIESSIVDPAHIFNYSYHVIKDFSSMQQIQVVRVEQKDKLYFLKKKNFDFSTNYLFINYLEKSFELVHPSIINLSGFSTNTHSLFYKYIQNAQRLNDIHLFDVDIQKIFLGVASGLSYLLSKGFYFSNFSINSIIYDENSHPKLIDYLSMNDLYQNSENDLILKYVDMIKIIIDKKKKDESTLSLNEELKTLIERCTNKTDLPTFEDFINFFKSSCFRTDLKIDNSGFIKYLKSSDNELIDDIKTSKYLSFERFNILPEYYIKALSKDLDVLSDKLLKYLYNEDVSLIIPDWQRLSLSTPIKIYGELMKKLNILEKQKNQTFYFSDKRKEIEYQMDSIRIQAIHYLKIASKESNDSKIKIELAIQYIKGRILPFNLEKALKILDSISMKNSRIENMIDKLKLSINNSTIENLINKIPSNQKERLEKAKKGDVFSLLFVGFAFYTGLNDFPISHPTAIQCYRNASKKSADAMALLGYLYLNGIFFPQNLKRARNCFKKAADKESLKAEIIDSIIRKHNWRSYLVKFNINDFFNNYLPSMKSMNSHDELSFPKLIYNITEGSNEICSLKLGKDEDDLKSNKNYNMIIINIQEGQTNNIESAFSEKILLSLKNVEDTNDVNKQLFIAKSYFYGENNFPVNYKKASEFLKLAADNGSSEAQWRYALMCLNSLGIKNDSNEVEKYFEKSVEQNDIKGKLYYAFYLKNNGDIHRFEQLIKDCCDSGNIDAMYYYAMYLESIDSSLEQSIEYYRKAANKGHFDSFIRLSNIYKNNLQTEFFEDCLELSSGMLNESFLVKLIHVFDKGHKYSQSNILIQLGINLNYQLFNFYFIDHLLYGKGMETNIERGKKLAILAFEDNYSEKYLNKYICIMLQALVLNGEHYKAYLFLKKYRKQLDIKYKKYFHLFYKNFDKELAHKYFISASFCCQEYVACYDSIMEFGLKGIDLWSLESRLVNLSRDEKNPYAMALLGKLLKKEKNLFRDLKTAVIYFANSAEKECPLGYYYIGKEYFYGRFLDQDYDKAKKYLLEAIKDDDEPRAGYYLFKIPDIRNDQNVDDVKLLETGATYGHKRALYEYGKLLFTGKDPKIQKDEPKGICFLKKAAQQRYKKAIRFLKRHDININKEDSINEDDSFCIEKSGDGSLDSIGPRHKESAKGSANVQKSVLNNNDNNRKNSNVDDSEIDFWL